MTPEEKLTVDLARLVRRHGPEAFESLANLLRDPEEAAKLASVLEGVLAMPRASSSPRASGPRPLPGAQLLEEVGKRDPELHELLSSVRDKLASGEIFRSISDLRRFADENGISLRSVDSRMRAIVPVLRFLASLPLDEAKAVIQPYEHPDDRSLARWSEVIMGEPPYPPEPV